MSEPVVMTESKCLTFALAGRKSKTLIWNVLAKSSGANLGYVAWFARWRNYCFFPNENLVLDKTCLRDIAAFVEYQSQQHRQGKRPTPNH